MRVLFWISLAFICINPVTSFWQDLHPKASHEEQGENVMSLIKRVLGKEIVNLFSVNITQRHVEGQFYDQVSFSVSKQNVSTKVEIVATSGVAAAWGINHYLKYFCQVQVAWDSKQMTSKWQP